MGVGAGAGAGVATGSGLEKTGAGVVGAGAGAGVVGIPAGACVCDDISSASCSCACGVPASVSVARIGGISASCWGVDTAPEPSHWLMGAQKKPDQSKLPSTHTSFPGSSSFLQSMQCSINPYLQVIVHGAIAVSAYCHIEVVHGDH